MTERADTSNTSASFEDKDWLDMIEMKNISANEVLLTGLLVNMTYRFRVRAYTREGPGPFSAVYSASAVGPESGMFCLNVKCKSEYYQYSRYPLR